MWNFHFVAIGANLKSFDYLGLLVLSIARLFLRNTGILPGPLSAEMESGIIRGSVVS